MWQTCFRRQSGFILYQYGMGISTLLQASAAAALGSSVEPDQSPLSAVSWEIVRGVCSALSGCTKKRAATFATFINTLLLPQLYVFKVRPAQACSFIAVIAQMNSGLSVLAFCNDY